MELINELKEEKKTRESGPELFKVIGILLVVLSHVVQTLESNFNNIVGFSDYILIFGKPTKDVQTLIISFLRYSGALGNSIFFISSAWYLIDKNKIDTKKIFRIISEIFLISVLWLGITLAFTNFKLTDAHIKKSFFPTYYSNTWYLTEYIQFCFIFPLLNIFIKAVKQKLHFIIGFILFINFGILAFFKTVYGESTFVLWISIYILIAYFKLYCPKFTSSFYANLTIFLIGLGLHIAFILGTNSYGLKHPNEGIYTTRWNGNQNIFLILIAYGLFQIFRSLKIKSIFINLVSSLSMLVYILHENIIFRQYYRPTIWHWIYQNLGYKLVLLWVFVFTILLFVSSVVIAYLYKKFIQKYVFKISDFIHKILMKGLDFIINKLVLIFK